MMHAMTGCSAADEFPPALRGEFRNSAHWRSMRGFQSDMIVSAPSISRYWRFAFAALVVAILLIPALGSMFANDPAWGAEDFIAAALILAATWLAIELSLKLFASTWAKAAGCGVAVFAALLIWAELALGVF